MFTGIIEEMGELKARDGGRFAFGAELVLEDAEIDDSIAVNGTCLTVVDRDDDTWSADLVAETLARTSLGSLEPGDAVNLERSVRSSDRLGGHMVQGHVDGVGTISVPAPEMRVKLPEQLCRYVVDKGSVTVDGVSLTVVQALDDGFTVALIPHTLEKTTLGSKKVGDEVNIEIDPIARYVERLLAYRGT